MILSDLKDKKIYIVAASNEYELVTGEKCMDVMSGRYLKKSFSSYNSYKKFILKSREKKNRRLERVAEKRNKEDKGDE